MLGISPPSAHDQVNQLVRKGYVKRAPGKARGLTIVREPAAEVVDLRAVPIVGKVAAGEPVLSEENVVGEVLVDSRAVPSGGAFALEVQGDSMIGAGIHDRDLVVVRQQPLAESGDIVVVLLGEEATVKVVKDATLLAQGAPHREQALREAAAVGTVVPEAGVAPQHAIWRSQRTERLP